MNIRNIKSTITRNFINMPGWRTKRKIVVIESDDWGSIRMPSTEVYNDFLKKGYQVDQSYYNRLDSLESNDDLLALYDILSKYRDFNGHHPVFTANSIVANPDFKRIKESGFSKYYYENVIETLKKYPNHHNVYNLWHEGIINKLFYPQFHGREHLNINRWLSTLKKCSDEIIFSFNNRSTYSAYNDYSFMEAFDQDNKNDINNHILTIIDGLKLFKDTFGYSSKSFIAPCYIWSSGIEKILFQNGVKYIQGSIFQNIPNGGFGKYKKKTSLFRTKK